MSAHYCPRCGLESSRDAWWDRHPVAAALLTLPAVYTLVAVLLANPWFFMPVLMVAAAWWVDRRNRRRAAIAARAEHEYRQQMVRAMNIRPALPMGSPIPPLRAGNKPWEPHWRVMNARTAPIATQPIKKG